MSHFRKLPLLAQPGAFGGGAPLHRWGLLLREPPSIRALLKNAVEQELLVPLSTVGRLRGGVVTRANAYFIVREVPFDQIPKRFRITRNDYSKVAVVMDGLETPFKIEREYLRPVIKGPDSIIHPDSVEETEHKLFVVDASPATLRAKRAHGALEYIRRGETFSYKVSDDSLKGGIPAQRSQIKNRKPHWYSLNVPTVTGPRILIPEHVNRRFVAALLDSSNSAVVIDKLFIFEPHNPSAAELSLASLNSLLGWYQIELRGRTQLGQGVLEVKKADLLGLLVLNPDRLDDDKQARILEAFSAVRSRTINDSADDVSTPERLLYDKAIFELLGCADPEGARLHMEREFRAAVSERAERRNSVAGEKLDRRRKSSAGANVDAYATRLASQLETHPNPSLLVPGGTPMWSIPIIGDVVGEITIGIDLFNQGDVFAGGNCVAHAKDMLGAQYVRGVLLSDPACTSVELPHEPVLTAVMDEWKKQSAVWRAMFNSAALEVLSAITDPRLKEEIKKRALTLLHAG